MTHDPAELTAKQKIEEMMAQVRNLPPGGDLASLLTREIKELAELAENEALAEREKAEENRRKAGFPPSTKPSS